MAKNGITKTAAFLSGINKAVANAAVITDHQGKNKDKMNAKTMVAIKLILFVFISYLVLEFVYQL